MGVETRSFERFVCDRCEKVEDVPCGDLDRRSAWGWTSSQRYQGTQIFARDYKLTLCPECCASLQSWASGAETDALALRNALHRAYGPTASADILSKIAYARNCQPRVG